MDERHDEIDSWLSEPVRPLLPPPGRFEEIRREARRRRTHRLSVVAAAAAVIVAAGAIAVPQLAGLTRGSAGQPALSGGPRQRSAPASQAKSPPPAAKPGLAPGSVTFVGTGTGWVLGECGGAGATTCLLRTDDGGKTWNRANPPPAGPPEGSTGVSQVRFLNTSVGWAFGPQLWVTHNAGRTWRRIPTHGMRVTALATRNDRVFAIWANCTGQGPEYAADCHSFSVYSATAAKNRWARVPGAGVQTVPGGAGGSARLVLTSTRAYLLPPDGILSAGVLAAGLPSSIVSWGPVSGRPAPCAPGPAQADGQPSQALLATSGPDLLLLCHSPGSGRPDSLYVSTNGGKTWSTAGQVPVRGIPTSLAGTPAGGTIVLAATGGIEVSTDAGATWRTAGGTAGRAGPAGGFAYAGMTTDLQGVALPADARGQHAAWLTGNGGVTWRRVPLP